MSKDSDMLLPLAVFAAETQGRLRYRLPLVTYTNAFEPEAFTMWMSPQVEAVTGYRADEWMEHRGFFERVLHPDDRQVVLEEVRASRERLQPFSRDYRLIARDGHVVWIHDESVPVLTAAGDPEFIQGYFFDITERKRLEDTVRHVQKAEAVGQMAAGIAHDFNNLLTAISGYAGAAEAQLPEEHPARRLLRDIAATVQRATQLTRRLLAFSRRQEPTPEFFDLATLVQDLESMLLHVAGANVQLDLQVEYAGEVCADLGQVEQVLTNLIANARDAMSEGGRISIATTLVTIERGLESERLCIAPGEYAALIVTDTGAGMDEETRRRVFEPFFTTKERDAGTGLGLSIVQGIVRQSGGAIDVTSAPGTGSTFRVLLPRAAFG